MSSESPETRKARVPPVRSHGPTERPATMPFVRSQRMSAHVEAWTRMAITDRSRRRLAISSPDVGALRGVARRTRLVRVVLVLAAVGLLLAAAASARSDPGHAQGLLPGGTTGVVILDVSLSIADEDYLRVRRTVAQLIADRSSVGLIIFSDVPYELLPPGTPARALRPLLRLLVPPQLGSAVNPWSNTFSAGTRISAAIEL